MSVQGQNHSALTQTAGTNCDTLSAVWGVCAGQYGYLTVQDFSTILTTPAADWNHALYAQDYWTIGHGLTLSLGIRIEKESLPAPGGVKVSSIDFPWSDKIEPRLGAAWDPTRKGKMKIFGSYGVTNDVMKLLLAQTSWGAQAYEQCSYALGPDGSGGFNTSDIDLVFKGGRACPNGPATTQANFASGNVPQSLTDAATGVSLIENINLRPWEPVAPGVKPYRQHEYVAGWDYEIKPGWAFEARYDRRRLDHVIEDASLSDIALGRDVHHRESGRRREQDRSTGMPAIWPRWARHSAFRDGRSTTRPITVRESNSAPARHALPIPRPSATTTGWNCG